MAEDSNKSEQKGGQKKAIGSAESATGPLSGQTFLKTVNDTLQQYLQSLRDAHANGMNHAEELSQEYSKSQREQQTVYDESVKEDYRNYVSSVQQAWGQDQAQAKVDDATRGYLMALNNRQMELRKNLEELQRKYMDTVQKHVNQVQQDYTNAYQDYLRSFQQGWARADLENMDSQTLASVGQALIAASNLAGQSMRVN